MCHVRLLKERQEGRLRQRIVRVGKKESVADGELGVCPSELEVTRRRNLPHFAASNHVSRSAVIGPTT